MDFVKQRIKEIFGGKFCNCCNKPAERLTPCKTATVFWCQQCYLDYTGRPKVKYFPIIHRTQVEIENEEEDDLVRQNNDLGYLYADQGKNLEQAEKMIKKAIAAGERRLSRQHVPNS